MSSWRSQQWKVIKVWLNKTAITSSVHDIFAGGAALTERNSYKTCFQVLCTVSTIYTVYTVPENWLKYTVYTLPENWLKYADPQCPVTVLLAIAIQCFALFACFEVLHKIWKFCMKSGYLILRKIFKFVTTRCQIIRLKCTKFRRPSWIYKAYTSKGEWKGWGMWESGRVRGEGKTREGRGREERWREGKGGDSKAWFTHPMFEILKNTKQFGILWS